MIFASDPTTHGPKTLEYARSIVEMQRNIADAVRSATLRTSDKMVSAVAKGTIDSGVESRLRGDSRAIESFVEEVLRVESPLQAQFRCVMQHTAIGGAPLPKDAVFAMFFGAGNHDERVFNNPDTIEIGRHNADRHLAFGFRNHHCPGNNLRAPRFAWCCDN